MDQSTSSPAVASPAATFEFRLWGRFSAQRTSDGAEVTPRGRKSRAILAYLLVEREPISRERLAALLWSERGQAQAHASLRQSLMELREFAPLLVSGRQMVELAAGGARTDLGAAFDAAARGDPDGLVAALPAGATLLEDLDGNDPAFDQWLRAARAERGQALVAAALEAGRSALDAGRADAAERLARRLQAIDPLDERAARLAMEAAHRAGQQEAVRRTYDQLAEGLKAELDVAPSDETQALHQRLTAPVRDLRGRRAVPPESARSADAEAALVPPVRMATARKAWRWRRWVAAAAALLLLASIGLIAFRLLDPFGAGAEPASLAVLPFRNLSPGDDYFADGLAEEILTQLAREPQLRVAGRTSSWLFKDRGADIRDVGRRLDVAYVLEGSVRRAGDRVRVDVALVDTEDGIRMWSQAFQGSLGDVLAIQRNIGVAVLGQLRIELVRAAPLNTRGDVYNLYLTARGLMRTREPAKVETATGLLRSALRIDPNYAPAWATLGTAVLLSRQNWSMVDTGEATRVEARRYVDRALALAPDLAEAHHARGMLDNYSLSTIPHLERAVQLEPGNAEFWYALVNARTDALDFEGALHALQRTAAIDPFWIRSATVSGWAWRMGSPEEALRFDQRLIRDHPEPFARELARARIAVRDRDWSTAHLHLTRASRIVPLTAQPRSDPDPIFVMIRLGLIDELRSKVPMPPLALRIIAGHVPTMDDMRSEFREPRAFWSSYPANGVIPRLMINAGRSADVVALYDGAFRSPEAMAADQAGGLSNFLSNGPVIAVALRDVGRGAEADRLLAIADRVISRVLSRGTVPFEFHELCARTWAQQGKRERALRALERAVAMGWQYDHLGIVPRLADEPVYRSLRNEPRLRRLDATIQRAVARERREVRALDL